MGNFLLRYKSRFSFFKRINNDLLGFYLYKKKLTNFRLYNFFFSLYAFQCKAIMYKRPYFMRLKRLTRSWKTSRKVGRYKYNLYRKMYKVRAKFFYYKFNFHNKFKRSYSDFFNKLFIMKKFRLFLGNMPMKQLLNYYYISLKDRSKSINSFLVLLERRLDVILFRLQIFKTFNQGKRAILHGYIFVNNICVTSYNYAVKENDIISFKRDIVRKLRSYFIRRLRKSKILLNIPRYILFNARIFKATIVYDLIKLNNVFYPSKDFFTIKNLFKIT